MSDYRCTKDQTIHLNMYCIWLLDQTLTIQTNYWELNGFLIQSRCKQGHCDFRDQLYRILCYCNKHNHKHLYKLGVFKILEGILTLFNKCKIKKLPLQEGPDHPGGHEQVNPSEETGAQSGQLAGCGMKPSVRKVRI